MTKNITSWFPLVLPIQKVFLNKEKLILRKGRNKSQEIFFKDIVKIIIKPLVWGFLYRTNDLQLVTHSRENILLFNITNSGTDKLINNIYNVNPDLSVDELTLETELLINGLIRTKDTSSGTRIPSMLIFVILSTIIIAFILFIIWFVSQ